MNKVKYKLRLIFILLLLALLFLVPIWSAKYFFHHAHKLGLRKLNYGKLIHPPIDFNQFVLQGEKGEVIPSEYFKGHWWLIYANASDDCRQACEQRLFYMRQIRIAQGKNMNRVKLLFLTLKPIKLPPHFNNLKITYGKMSHQMLNSLGLTEGKGCFYLVDPLGNLMMTYPPHENPSHILKDLKRLLKVSQIG